MGTAPRNRDNGQGSSSCLPLTLRYAENANALPRRMNAPLAEQFLTLQEIVAAAQRNLPPGPWSYLIGGAETETTVKRNRHALDSIAFRPRVLRNVSKLDSSALFLGRKVRLPVMLAPIGGLES